MFGATLSRVTAEACVPEQLVHYVRAVSGRRAALCRGFAVYSHEGHAVLAAYPGAAEAEGLRAGAAAGLAETDPPLAALPYDVAPALAELSASHESLTVLAPFVPQEAPSCAAISHDCYWDMPLPAPEPGQKLRNMLRRAGREVVVGEEAWSTGHQALVDLYLRSRPLLPGTRAVFAGLPAYLDTAEARQGKVLLFTARRAADGALAAFAVGDVSALSTAFYMFAFRHDDAPPGTSDLLLAALAERASAEGHMRLNLGLGISGGISFFKKKWRAAPFLPYVETSWKVAEAVAGRTGKGRPGLLARLLGR